MATNHQGNQNRGEERKNYNLREFMYKKQFQRKAHILFVPLSKPGFKMTIVFLVVFFFLGGGIVSFMALLLVANHIYKYKFPYKYYDFERLYVVSKVVDFATKRRKHFLKHSPLFFTLEKKRINR